MWLYSSPLEALVVVVITGTDRTVISYININSLMLVSVRCPLRPLGLAWSPTPTGWCVGDGLHDLMCCGCMAIWLYIMCR